MKILVLDNYDSFTYNLVHIIRELGYGNDLDVYRNDKINLSEIDAYDKILLSPGPGIPSEAGIMLELIRQYASTKSILGICLGHQGISEVFGAKLYNMPVVLHGVGTPVLLKTNDDYLFTDIPDKFEVCRYHSWAVEGDSVNGDLEISAVDNDNIVMGVRHKKLDVRGLQFHPESIVTENGKTLIQNWIHHNQ